MKKLTVLILTIAFLSISNFAFAGKDSGPYIGGSLGNTSLDLVIDNDFSLDDNDFGYKIFAGYNFGLIPMFDFAVEASYIDFGEVSAALPTPFTGDVNFGITAFDLFGVAAYNIGPIGIFGKVGQVWWDGEISSVDLGSYDTSDNDMAYGIGVRFQFSSIAIRAEYERFDIEGDVDLDFISAGISWTF
jgi:outer membrane immunogenic protein